MNNQTDYPPLPKGRLMFSELQSGVDTVYSVEQMHAFVDADRKARVPDQWPIVKLTVTDDGKTLAAAFYTPGLPDGAYDLYLPESL